MKLMVYEPKKDEEPVTWLCLKDLSDGSVIVAAVDSNGETFLRGALALFTKDGRIYRSKGIDPDLGFDLDEAGRINLQLS